MKNSMFPQFVIMVEKDWVEGLNLVEYQRFLEALEEAGVTIEAFACYYQESTDFVLDPNGEPMGEHIGFKLLKKYKEFQEAFREEFGLTLCIGYHSKENGSLNDDVDGYFFHFLFGEVYQLTGVADKVKHIVPFRNVGYVSNTRSEMPPVRRK